MSGIESWSTTPANNNQSPPFGWPAGILPSQVEPIGRQMMASLAAWYQAAEWINYNFTPVYVSSTQFTIAGNVTSTYHVGRRVQATDGSTSVYGTITASAFTTLTTITVAWDSGVLQTGVTIVYVGITSKVNTSAPVQALTSAAFANPSATIGLTAVNGTALTAMSSDSAPPLSQAISPTWSGTHTFSNAIAVNGGGSSLKGGVAITAPASGDALTITPLAGTHGIVVAATSTDAIIRSQSTTSGNVIYQATTAGQQDWSWGVDRSDSGAWKLAASTVIGTSTQIKVTATGNTTFSSAASGTTVTVGVGAAGSPTISVGSTEPVKFFDDSTLPASLASGISIAGGASSPVSGRIIWGDGSGWQMRFAKRTGSATTDLITFSDSGAILTVNGVSGTHSTRIADSAGTVFDAGYLDTPLNTQNAPYTAVVSDRGKTINMATTGNCTFSSGVFAAGSVVSVRCPSGVTTTIVGSGVTLNWAGNGATTGNRTLTGEGLCTILFLSGTVATISGAGLT